MIILYIAGIGPSAEYTETWRRSRAGWSSSLNGAAAQLEVFRGPWTVVPSAGSLVRVWVSLKSCFYLRSLCSCSFCSCGAAPVPETTQRNLGQSRGCPWCRQELANSLSRWSWEEGEMSSFQSPLELGFHFMVPCVGGVCWFLILFSSLTSDCTQIKPRGCCCRKSCGPSSPITPVLFTAHVLASRARILHWGKAGPVARASLCAEISRSLADSQPATELRRREFVSMRSLIWSYSAAKNRIGVLQWI